MTETVSFQTQPTGPEAPQATGPEGVQQNQQQQQQPQERPAWLPENFKTVEDYAKALADTQAALTRTTQELAAIKKGKQPTAEKKPDDKSLKTPEGKELEVPEEDQDNQQQPVEIDFAPYQEEFTKTGDVSEESRVKIAESLKGMFGENARAVVDDYIEGAKYRVTNTTTQLKAIAGGDEGYARMVMWAKDNLSKEEVATFNRQVNSGDFHAASFAVHALSARYTAANGKAPNLLNGDGGPSDSSAGFKSLYEMTQAQRDPRYKSDPDYRKMVEQKAARSNF